MGYDLTSLQEVENISTNYDAESKNQNVSGWSKAQIDSKVVQLNDRLRNFFSDFDLSGLKPLWYSWSGRQYNPRYRQYYNVKYIKYRGSSEAQKWVDAINEQITGPIQDAIKGLQENIAKIEAKLATTEQERNALEVQFEALNTEKESLQREVLSHMQIINALKSSNKKLGVLINFGEISLYWKRYVN
jgi:hypothetical protein